MSRDIVAAFIGANSSEIVFTSGATESINIVANGIEYEDDSEIIVSILEHHSNYLPWIEKAKV
ncbi:aminotransferase class V-fold PLP-dependent enzyme, partial [Bacillus atrophaeus]